MLDIDSSGVSMSWKTAGVIIAVVVSGALTFTAYAGKQATKVDLGEHNVDDRAHPIVVEDENGKSRETTVPELVIEHEEYRQEYVTGFKNIKNEVKGNTKAVGRIEGAQHDARAEDLAYRAVEKMPKTTAPRRKIQEFERVKRRAKSNLEDQKDIREGLEDVAF